MQQLYISATEKKAKTAGGAEVSQDVAISSDNDTPRLPPAPHKAALIQVGKQYTG